MKKTANINRDTLVIALTMVPLFLGLSGWLGWLTGHSLLASVRPDFIPMAPNTATGFLFTSLALISIKRGWNRNLAAPLLIVPLFLAGIRFMEMVGGFQTGIERLLWAAPREMLGVAPVGEMAMTTAVSFILLVLAIWRLSLNSPASILSVMSMSIGAVFLLGYLYGAPLLYGTATIPMALTTALSFVFCGTAALTENSNRYFHFEARVKAKRKEMADALQDSAENLRSLVDSNPNGLVVIGAGGEQLFINPAAEEILAHAGGQILNAAPEAGCEFVLDDKRVVYETVHPIEWRGGEASLYSIKDTTELRRSEQKFKELERQFLHSQKMEAVGRLAGGVAHDFNNLLTAIIGYTTMLQESEYGPAIEQDLAEILKASNRAADLSHRLLAFSRAHSLEVVTLDLKERVRQTEALLRRLLRPEIELVCKIEDSDPAWVLAVPSAIEQVVLNLVVNAQDALEGKGRISVEVEQVQLDEAYADNHIQIEPGSYVLLKVSDTGTGIPPEHLPHIFEPYYTTKEKGKGTGLGLSTIYGIVQQCQGSVHVYSVPGRGSTFKVYLPEALPPNGSTISPKVTPVTKRSSMNILLVEDEQSIQRLATRLLERAGHKVACCDTAEKALRLLRNDTTSYDLLVTDMVLPGQSGLDLVCQVPRQLPTILMSGYSEQGLPEREAVLERIVFLEKPFSLAQFESKIEEAVGRPFSGNS